MASVRDTLVTAIQGHLTASLAVSADSVFDDLATAVQHDELPALCVDWETDTPSIESRDMDDEGNEIQVRDLVVRAMVIAGSRSAADDLALAAEKALATSSIGDERTLLDSSKAVEHDGKKPIHGVLLRWSIQYQVLAAAPDVRL